MFNKVYKKKRWRIRKHTNGSYYVQSSRFGIFWEDKKSRYYGYRVEQSTTFFSSVEEAKAEAIYFAQQEEHDFYFNLKVKAYDRQNKKFVVDLGRLP